ncbi:MAG: hypothetical protein WBN66_12580 [Smithella sp.]
MLTLSTLKDPMKKLPFEDQLVYRAKTGTGKVLKRELRAKYWAGHKKKIGG